MTDDSAMEEGRLEEIEARCKDGNPYPVDMEAIREHYRFPWTRKDDDDGAHITDADGVPVKYSREERARIERNLFMPAWNAAGHGLLETDVPDLLTEVRRLRAENDALKQQLQALREREYPDFAPGPWSECGGFIVDANDAPVFEIVSEESHHKIAIRNFMDQLQALRQGDHPCRELVQEIADSRICWSDWAGDYIQWTEDITRKARKALGLKDE